MDSRRSPSSAVRHRRYKEMNSSQESLSSPAPQRPSSRTSFVDVKERESDNEDGSEDNDDDDEELRRNYCDRWLWDVVWPSLQNLGLTQSDSHDSFAKDEGQRSSSTLPGGGHESVNNSRSGSPDKPQNTFERSSNAHAQNPHQYPHHQQHHSNNTSTSGSSPGSGGGGDPASPNVQEHRRNGASPSVPGDHLLHPDVLHNKNLHERTFETSLDNILNECTKVSVDPSLSNSLHESIKTPSSITANNMQASAPRGSRSDKKRNRFINMMSTKYKSRSDDFRRMFKDIPRDERLIVDYSCAMQKDILVQGRMYVSQNWICFYAKIFNWETALVIPCKDITAITKEKTARVIPNAIQITTDKERYFFTSFGARDKTYMMLFRIWQNALLDQPMSTKELWTWIHYNYGDDLGLTTSDEDYEAPQGFVDDLNDKLKMDLPGSSKEMDGMDTSTEVTSVMTSEPTTHRGSHGTSIGGGGGGGGSNEDTDALVSDEVFNSHSPITPSSSMAAASANAPPPLTSSPKAEGGGGGAGGGGGGGSGGKFIDSSDDSDGEVLCRGHDHLEKLYMDEVYNLNIDTVFTCLFTDCDFFRTFVKSRKTFDLNLPPWEEDPDENGNKVRSISYTLTLNNSIGPKTSPTTEKQICYSSSQPGRIYHIDCETCNGGIPYSESFYVILRYCMTRVTPVRCRLVMTAELKYRKHIMGMFKGMIEKSAVNGLTDYCRQLSVHLRREAERLESIASGHQAQVTLTSQTSGHHKRKVRKKRVKQHVNVMDSPNRQTDTPTSIPPSPTRSSSQEDRLLELNAHTLVRIIVVILVLLLLFNAVLFYKLWSLESYASSLYGSPSQESLDSMMKQPRTPEEWSHLLLQQKKLHEKEIEKWEEVLSTSISIVDQMKTSLVDLRRTLHVRTSSQPWEQS